jgi:hypothetical protein
MTISGVIMAETLVRSPYILSYLLVGLVFAVVVWMRTGGYAHFMFGRPALFSARYSLRAYLRDRFIEDVVAVVGNSLLISLWPLASYFWTRAQIAEHRAQQFPANTMTPCLLKMDDLGHRMEVGEIEAREMVDDPLDAVPKLPFGHLNRRWQILKTSARNAQWWFYHAASPERGTRGGDDLRAGYVARRGRVLGPERMESCRPGSWIKPIGEADSVDLS